MTQRGALIVFEGPDGAGKSALARTFALHLQSGGERVAQLSFPGLEVGTLGYLVYRLHHDPSSIGVRELTPTSLQALHVAAHLDAIDRSIRPIIAKGETVILDRYWWSTWVYGVDAGVPAPTLDAMIACEQAHWAGLLPVVVLVITRQESLKAQDSGIQWRRRATLYSTLAEREAVKYPVRTVSNDGTQAEAVAEIVRIVADVRLGSSHAMTSPNREDVRQ
jgi:dTMP kinase